MVKIKNTEERKILLSNKKRLFREYKRLIKLINSMQYNDLQVAADAADKCIKPYDDACTALEQYDAKQKRDKNAN